MRENRPQEKGDQSLYFRRGRAGARGRPVGGRRGDGGHGEWPDIGRTRHDVAAYKPHRGTLGSSSTACGRRTGRHRKSSGKCPTGNVAHVAGPVDRKRSPAACESRGLDNGKPYVSVFRNQLLVTGLFTVAESGPAAVTAGSPVLPASNTIPQASCQGEFREMTDDDEGCGRAMEMAGRWKAWKSKSSFPTLSTAPWKSRKGGEIPTFPQPQAAVYSLIPNRKTRGRWMTMMKHMQMPTGIAIGGQFWPQPAFSRRAGVSALHL